MKTYTVKELYALSPAEKMPAKVQGWVRTCRQSKNVAFIELNDGSFFTSLQIVVEADKLENYADVMRRVTVGASLECEATSIST